MADTGSEMAEIATREAVGVAVRLLERHFLWSGRDHEASHQPGAEEGNVTIDVRCPPAGDAERAQRALERLHASGRSGFSLEDVTGPQLVEAATGRRTRGTNTFDATPAPEARATPTPEAGRVASSTVTFANHPADPERDRGHAEAYARGMREMGFDAEARTVTSVRGGDGRYARPRGSVVAVSYPARDRDDFALASLVVLHEVGALGDLGREDPYLSDVAAYERDRERLMASADSRRTRFGQDVGAVADAHVEGERGPARGDHVVSEAARNPRTTDHTSVAGENRGRGGKASGDPTPRAKEMTLEEYDSLPVRERAKVEAKDVPEGAFGRQGIREAASEATAAAAALAADREPARTHPAIGERIS